MGNENLTPVVEEVGEIVVKEAPKFNWKRTGIIGLAVVGTAGIGYGIYRLIKYVKTKKESDEQSEE